MGLKEKEMRLVFLVFIVIGLSLPNQGYGQIQTLLPENLNNFPADYLKDRCEPNLKAPIPTHHVTHEHLKLEYWLKQWQKYHDLNQPILKAHQIGLHAQSLSQRSTLKEPITQIEITQPLKSSDLLTLLEGRLSYLKDLIHQNKYVNENRTAFSNQDLDLFESKHLTQTQPLVQSTYHISQSLIQNLCAPYLKSIYQSSGDQSIDRNACTAIRKGELVEHLGDWGDDLILVRTRLSLGWIPKTAALSVPLSKEDAVLYEQTDWYFFKTDASLNINAQGEAHLLLTSDASNEDHTKHFSQSDAMKIILKKDQKKSKEAPILLVPEQSGLKKIRLLDQSLDQFFYPDQLNAKHFLSRLFSHLGLKYGLGDGHGGIDCSRMIVDIFDTYHLPLPRYSGHQAFVGSYTIDLKEVKDSRQRYAIIDQALKSNLVLLALPGHIMVYLGKDQNGRAMAFHALADYLMPCDQNQESILSVNQATVTDLERGRGSSRGAYIDRISHVVILGNRIDDSLLDMATPRPVLSVDAEKAIDCNQVKNQEQKLFFFPKKPNPSQAFRIILTSPKSPVEGELILKSSKSKGSSEDVIRPKSTRIGGPPYLYEWVFPVGTLAKGNYQVQFGEADQILACRHLQFNEKSSQSDQVTLSEWIWQPIQEWTSHEEALYAGFIEKLFDYEQEDRSWTNLQDLVLVSEKNILHDYLGKDEDKKLRLEPDCADLPYTLRAYFAWKMRLPYAIRNCSRGSAKSAPQCESNFMTSMMPREGRGIGEDFQWFARAQVSKIAHSASVRTLPQDDATDLYPIDLTKEALRPGIVYADPYGHILLISSWKRQKIGQAGALIASDGQPDGTIARRRFWEGSFLFDPSTQTAGAGFKAFRPLIKDQQTWRPLNNQELTRQKMGALSWQYTQYEISKTGFYDRMNALINPLFMDPMTYLESLIQALHESAKWRVLSVQNGVDNIEKNPRKVIEMPKGYSIFETSGAWEDYATPSRDMRLLISIDTVLSARDAVERNQNRFGIFNEDSLKRVLQEIDHRLNQLLQAQSIEYRKSNGDMQRLSLMEIVDRKKAFEVTYNPNDCAEFRWGAKEGSQEMQSCQRRAPKSQQALMEKYRTWFKERKRPSRGTK